MKTLAYFECPTGISGDMCLGALIDAGVPLDYLETQLGRLGLSQEYQLQVDTVLRQGQAASKVSVILLRGEQPSQAPDMASHSPAPAHGHNPDGHGHGGHHHDGHDHGGPGHDGHHNGPGHGPHPDHGPSRHLQDITKLIQSAHLPPKVKDWSLAIFQRLAEAEAAVHGTSPEQVHFHEVGAVDAIVDIVGTCLGLDWLGVERLVCSPLPTGGGWVRAAHGLLPVPAPAVLRLLQMRQVPIYSNGIQKELVTPTGAAIATTLAESFGPPPAMTLVGVGLGAGGRDLEIPNLLRLWLGEPAEANSAPQVAASGAGLTPAAAMPAGPQGGLETVTVLETQIDDITPQAIGHLYQVLLSLGALDMFTQAVGMKKSRPGILITVICWPDQVETLEQAIFTETTTLGIRRQQQCRRALTRRFEAVATDHGPVQMKLAHHPDTGRLLNVQPEYEDCAAIAQRQGLPWQMVHQAALAAWYRINPALELVASPPSGGLDKR